MVSFSEEWTCIDAIVAMFFAHKEDLQQFNIDEAGVRLICLYAFERQEWQADSGELLIHVDDIVQSIMKSMPGVTASSRRHPLIWARWAFMEAPSTVSELFIERLAEWKLKVNGSNVMQHQHPIKKIWGGRTWTTDTGIQVHGYLLDEVLLGKRLKCNVYSVQWRMRAKVLVPSGGQQVPHEKHAINKSFTSPKRDVTEVCGLNVVTILGDVILDAVKSKELLVLSSRKVEGRYQSTVSREGLVKLLKKNYPALKSFKDGTLCRALSSFVECPRGRPGGVPKVSLEKAAVKTVSPPRR